MIERPLVFELLRGFWWGRLHENGVWIAPTSKRRLMLRNHDSLYIALGRLRIRIMKPTGQRDARWQREIAGLNVDLYAVGLLANLRMLKAYFKTGVDRKWVRHHFWYSLRHNWRRKNFYNGWMAEPKDSSIPFKRCGTGWTRARAIRRLGSEISRASA